MVAPWQEWLGIKPAPRYLDINDAEGLVNNRYLYALLPYESSAESILAYYNLTYVKQASNITGVTEYVLSITASEYNTLALRVNNLVGVLLSPIRRGDFGSLYTSNPLPKILSSINTISGGSATIGGNALDVFDNDLNTAITANRTGGSSSANNTTTFTYTNNQLTVPISAGTQFAVTYELAATNQGGQVTLQYSNDLNNWTTFFDYGYTNISKTTSYVTLPESAKYFRFTILKNNTGNGTMSLYEIALF